jgi:diguanylate cyclase (GGDEF)-like protein/PAS domain S-box-containing protein
MYHCNVQLYIISSNDRLLKIVQKMPPLEKFEHDFSQSSSLEKESAAGADVIFVDLPETEIKKIIQDIAACKKQNAELVLLADETQRTQLTEKELSLLDELWVTPMTDAELKFRFAGWQKNFKMKKDLWLTQNYLDTTINSVPHMVWYKDKAGAHLKVNNSFCDAVNKTMEQVQGRGHYYIWDLTPETYAAGEFICMESEFEVIEKKKTCVFEEDVKIHDELRHLKTFKTPLFDLDGSVMGTVGVATDVTQERLYEQMLQKNANTDSLTGLYNRRYISECIEKLGEVSLVIYYLDLDNFKTVNDRYGHQEGDDALTLTADVLRASMPGGIVSRIGGDEFLVIEIGDYTDDEIEEKRIWLREQLETAFSKREHLNIISASIGTAHSTNSKNVMDELISEADKKMYSEKKDKKNRRRSESA